MVNPNPLTGTWVDADAPDLNLNTYDGNYPILLDGSILKVGGYGAEPDPSSTTGGLLYPARKQPELMETAGIFAAPATGWKLMKAQLHERRYHSVAVTLPNGKVVSAGGNDTEVGESTPEPSWYSAEVFSPPYLFNGRRPRILTFPAEVSLGQAIDFTAVLRTASIAGEFRVALLAPGAATHAFDQHQHFIKLKLGQFTANPDPLGVTLITAFAPEPLSLPPGWYMLVVVNSYGVPGAAKWIKVLP